MTRDATVRIVRISQAPFHPSVIREWSVTPPKDHDPSAITGVIMVREGVYTVQHSVCCEPDNTRQPWIARAEERPNEFLATAVQAFGEQAKQGDCTMANVHFYLLNKLGGRSLQTCRF